MLIDTHCHICFPEFESDVDDVIKRANVEGVLKFVSVGCDFKSIERSAELVEKYDGVFASAGLHPYDADDWNEESEAFIRKYLAMGKFVAIGETGLDYFKCDVDHEVQKASFRGHLRLAAELGLPVIVHNREADEDSLALLQEFPGVKAVFHCYGSDLAFARRVWGLGYYTSFTGIVTYKSAEELREVVAACPEELFFLETDCPYLAPQGNRGERNEPGYMREIAYKVAEVRGLSVAEVEEISTRNAEAFFNI